MFAFCRIQYKSGDVKRWRGHRGMGGQMLPLFAKMVLGIWGGGE